MCFFHQKQSALMNFICKYIRSILKKKFDNAVQNYTLWGFQKDEISVIS